jgi:hypothetical protein
MSNRFCIQWACCESPRLRAQSALHHPLRRSASLRRLTGIGVATFDDMLQ